jgi:tryptophan-rich hypothetical protein
MNPVNSKKLLRSKWTAVAPVNKEKHFMVVSLIEPEVPEAPIVEINIESVYSNNIYQIAWADLKDTTKWRQGWV